MKKILLVISLISVLFLAGCNKNETIDNLNIPENIDSQQQEAINNDQEQIDNKELIIENNEDEYQEITEDLLTNYEGLYVTNVVKNENDTYTLQGTLFGDYVLTNDEMIEIENKGKLEVGGEEWMLKLDEYSSEKRYQLVKSNDDSFYKYEIRRLNNESWELILAAQISSYYKSSGIEAKITVNKDVICNEYFQDKEGTGKTVEDTFSSFESSTAPNDVGVGKIWNLEMKDGKCVKLSRFLGL